MDPERWIEENLEVAKQLPLEALLWQTLRAGYFMGIHHAVENPCCRMEPVPDLKLPKPFVDQGSGI